MAAMKTYNNATTREDLLSVIKNIKPMSTPIYHSLGSALCSSATYVVTGYTTTSSASGTNWFPYVDSGTTHLYESPVTAQLKEALKGLL